MLHSRTESASSKASSTSSASTMTTNTVRDFILLTPYPVEPGHTLITISRVSAQDWRPEMRANAAFVAEGDNAGIIINKPASIMDYNKIQAGQKERQQPPSAKMSFKVFLINSETSKLTLEHRTLRFWLDHSAIISGKSSKVRNNGLNNNDEVINNEDSSPMKTMRSFASLKQESSQLAQAYFCQLIGSNPDEFPKNYVGFIMKLMRQLKASQFSRIIKMEVELRQLAQDEAQQGHHHYQVKPPSPVASIDGSQSGESGRGSPLTSQKVLDIIESSYPNPVSIKEICSSTQTDVTIVKQLVDELAQREKINSTDDGQHYTRTLKACTDTKVQLVKQMPKVQRAQQPVIAIITAQYCEKLAVDSMISDKETFVRYRVTAGQDGADAAASSNYVYTLGNIGDHRVVSTKLTSVGHSRGALIAAGNATTRLLGTFPEIEYVFLVGCGGGVPNYTDFCAHVRLGDIVVSHLPGASSELGACGGSNNAADALDSSCYERAGGQQLAPSDFVYVHCKPKAAERQQQQQQAAGGRASQTSAEQLGGRLPMSYSVHKNLKRASEANGIVTSDLDCDGDAANARHAANSNAATEQTSTTNAPGTTQTGGGGAGCAANSNKLSYDECHFRLWRPARLDLQELAQRLWLQGLDNAKHRIWDYYIEEGIKALKQQEIDAARPAPHTDKLFMSIGLNDTIEVSHPEAADDELDLRREGQPMCHFGPIGSGKPALSGANEQLKQQMISQFSLRAFDSEFDPVVESIYGNCKESYIMIRGISDYKDGRKRKDWQQYAALVAAAFMKSIIVNLKPLG